jgi:hypothetical protein
MTRFTLILFLVLSSAVLQIAASPVRNATVAAQNVYICNSKESVAYHSTKSCKGLNKCTHEVLTVTLQDAQDRYNRRACKMCY